MTNFTERAVPTLTANFLMQEAKSRYVFAKKYIDSKKTVLDLACGTGYGSQVVTQVSGSYIGIDVSAEALNYAQKNYASADVSFLKMDVNKMIFNNASFNSIIAYEMIEHLKHPETFLKEVVRVLSSRGVFIVSTPNRLVQSPDGTLMSPYHTKEYSPEEFSRLLKQHFKKVELFGQRKSTFAKSSVDHFMFSQKIRQALVDADIFRIRKHIAGDVKEHIWKVMGNLVGRGTQERVTNYDFIFRRNMLNSSEYLIAVCKK